MKRTWAGLPFNDWPEVDREAWNALLSDGDVLDGRGTGWHWAGATRATLIKHYSGWLRWLNSVGALRSDEFPTDRVSPAQATAYARALMACVSDKTVDSYVRDLKVVVKAMSPDLDWAWLTAMSTRLKAWAKPSRVPELPTISAACMFQTALGQLSGLAADGMPTRRACLQYRDVLLIAILICAPIRLRNLTMIRIGDHLRKESVEWHLRFSGQETKTGQPLHLVLHPDLTDHIETYLREVRPTFRGAGDTDRLWVACKGKPMAEHSIYDRIKKTSDLMFGVAISPHAFRSIAATFLAEVSPADALRARPLLGHRRMETTEDHYIRAQQMDASRKVADAIITARGGKTQQR